MTSTPYIPPFSSHVVEGFAGSLRLLARARTGCFAFSCSASCALLAAFSSLFLSLSFDDLLEVEVTDAVSIDRAAGDCVWIGSCASSFFRSFFRPETLFCENIVRNALRLGTGERLPLETGGGTMELGLILGVGGCPPWLLSDPGLWGTSNRGSG